MLCCVLVPALDWSPPCAQFPGMTGPVPVTSKHSMYLMQPVVPEGGANFSKDQSGEG